MLLALARHGVALKILTGLALLVLLTVLGGVVAIHSFREANNVFTTVASTQIDTMSDAAELREHTQAIASLAPGLFARELNEGSLLDFTTKAFNQQNQLQALIDKLSSQVKDSQGLASINAEASALFDNADSLSTAIYEKAALQDSIDKAIGELVAIRDNATGALEHKAFGEAAVAIAIRSWIAAFNALNSTALESLATTQPNALSVMAADMAWHLREAEIAVQSATGAEPLLGALQKRLAAIAGGPQGFIIQRQKLLLAEREIEDLFQKNEQISGRLAAAVDLVVESIRNDVAAQNQTLNATLAGRSRLLLIMGCLGLTGALAVGAFTQMSVVGRLNRLRRAMTGGHASEDALDLTRGSDEIAEMAQSVVNYVNEINRREEDIKRSSLRLTSAIETLPTGFSLYDAEDHLVVCNTRYRELLYPGIEDFVQPGQSFEMVVRKSIERGHILIPHGGIDEWVAERIEHHRNPHGLTVQQRANGVWVEIGERRAENGDIVAIYTDITEHRNFEAQIIAARENAERAKDVADEKSRTLERLSERLSKYLSPQVFASIFTGKNDITISSSRKKLTIFFADVADFTETTDSMESEELTALLNHYLTEMSRIALSHGATIDKYIGDAIMIFFGDPETRGVKEDAVACVNMAVAMQRRMRELEADWRGRGIQRPFRMRVGINTGFCTVGNFGSEDRMDYTIIGSEVNLASRLQFHAELGGILLAHETYALVKDLFPTEEQNPIVAKGFADPIRVHKVLGVHDQVNGTNGVISAHMDGAEMHIDIEKLSEADRVALRNLAQDLVLRLQP
ncbi:adenylate/guanylate cyclase domain-containing protein [Mesorhizobium sp. LjNodule214]|uniref:adenylate/guanylate cyclase domain-containing protein n=1 Tax=Mesorhizobium sp. LjNodule214 TaxID=3342252 RepID=UPI003ED0594E